MNGLKKDIARMRRPSKLLEELEDKLATFDQTLYMGCNDLTSAEYISKKCGKVAISVTNNQMPLMPLFSPIYTSTRPYSQTRSNTQRDLMLPDEILRLDRRQCIALFQGRKPALLYKLTPEELPDYMTLKSCRVIDYIPEWKQRVGEGTEGRAKAGAISGAVTKRGPSSHTSAGHCSCTAPVRNASGGDRLL